MSLFQLLLYIGLASVAALFGHYAAKKQLPNAWMSFIQYFTGFLFLVSGWVKAVDPLGTAYKMEQYFAEFEIAFEGSWFSFLAPVFPWLSGLAIGFSVFMIIFEIILGFMILIGAFPRFTSWAFFLLILFFTALTGFTYLTGYVPSGENFFNFSTWQAYNPNNMRVTDCGCFGDFIKLEPKISFFKDVVLLVPALLFLLYYRKMHHWGTPSFHRISIGAFAIILFVYCLSNYVWDLPHIDFRPFREGVNVAETKEKEDEAMANVQVLAFKLKDKSSGEVIEVSYSDYLAGISSQYSPEKYEVAEQIKSDPEIEATKISDFEFLDAEGNDMTDDFLQDPGYKLLLVGHKLKYDVEPIVVKVQDTVFTYDTIWIGEEDFMEMILSKNVASITEREEQQYKYTFDPDFLDAWRSAAQLASEVSKSGVRVVALAGGAGQDPIQAFIRETGADFPVYEADDILLKTIIRSNPGYVAWKGGEILEKWHYKKVDAQELEKVFRE